MTDIPEDSVRKAGDQARNTRIIFIDRYNYLLYIAIFFVISNIVLPSGYNLILLAGLIVFLIMLLLFRIKPRQAPPWFRPVAQRFINRMRENPLEASVLLLIILLATIKNAWLDMQLPEDGSLSARSIAILGLLRELTSAILLLCAFLVSGKERSSYRRNSGGFFGRKKHESVVMVRATSNDEADEEMMTSEEMKAAENRQLWESKQQQRWEQWLHEEIDRLNDDK